MRDYHEVLRRIAAILLVLATVAERAADRSRPVRWLVLWVLQRAEAVASAYVAEVDPLAIEYSTLQLADGGDEATRLAATFHIFATMLFALADQAELLAMRAPSEQPSRGYPSGYRANVARLLRALAVLQPRYADTS